MLVVHEKERTQFSFQLPPFPLGSSSGKPEWRKNNPILLPSRNRVFGFLRDQQSLVQHCVHMCNAVYPVCSVPRLVFPDGEGLLILWNKGGVRRDCKTVGVEGQGYEDIMQRKMRTRTVFRTPRGLYIEHLLERSETR